jgi:imidazolonepropionase-like amidohydrolase
MTLIVSGVTVIDGVSDRPAEGRSIWIERGRIKAIAPQSELRNVPGARVIQAGGKFAIPGLMNANVHLFPDARLESLARYWGRYEGLIAESAQVALKGGLTTVFDTWGPRRFLMAVRDGVARGDMPGSRCFCAGNIIGFDGPLSTDFFAKAAEVASGATVRRINAIWVENTGRHLMWQTPEQVASEVRAYIGKGIDFVKYASNEHYGTSGGAFLAFSPRAQEAIAREARRAGRSVQAHTTSVEGLRIAVEAGCNLVQHANITGPVPIPSYTLDLMAERRVGAVVFPFTQRRLDWIGANVSDLERTMWGASDSNVCNLIRSGVPLLLGNDGSVMGPARLSAQEKHWATPGEDNLIDLATGHFSWFKAMEEKGCAPMEMLRAATLNIAVAYGKSDDLGSLQPGKVADILVLDRNPLLAAENYRTIYMIIKDGEPVECECLPLQPIQTKVPEPAEEEEASFVPFVTGSAQLPMCPMCCLR